MLAAGPIVAGDPAAIVRYGSPRIRRPAAWRPEERVEIVSDDKRLAQAASVAADKNATADDIRNALKSAKAATIDSHNRCGAECNWTDQAGYFVARATVAALTPAEQLSSASPAWQAAMSSRMARTSILIDSESSEQGTHSENEWQYEILSNYLKT